MRKFFLALILLTSFYSVNAQMPMGMMCNRSGKPGGQNMNIGHFYGKIVDNKTNRGIAGVTVQLSGNKFDTVSTQMKQAILKTVITETNGRNHSK